MTASRTAALPEPQKPADWHNPTLPGRRDDIRAMSEQEWKDYRAGIVRILTSAAESDQTRQQALLMLLEADRRLWVNGLANGTYFADPVAGTA